MRNKGTYIGPGLKNITGSRSLYPDIFDTKLGLSFDQSEETCRKGRVNVLCIAVTITIGLLTVFMRNEDERCRQTSTAQRQRLPMLISCFAYCERAKLFAL